jgi:hemerythrin-like metal-binding protein
MADLITWGPTLFTGIKIIDDDHKKLVDMLNRLNDAMGSGKSKEVLGTLLDELVQYTVKHFGNEERLMAEHKYADAATHMGQHKKLVADVVAFKEKLAAGKAMISIELMKFLKEWLANHIMQTDKKLGQALTAAGVK